MAETVAVFGSARITRDVLLLVPELLFFSFTAVVALQSGFGLVASLQSDEKSRRTEEHKVSGKARLISVVGAAMLAATVVPMLLTSLKLVLVAPVKVVIVAAAAAAAMVVAAVLASVVVVVTVSAVMVASALVLARIYHRFHKSK